MSSFHHPLPPAARKPRALRHCETASLSAWTRRRNLSNLRHVRESPNLTWVWRNLKSLPFSSSFTSKSTIDKGQPSKQKACIFKLVQVLLTSLRLPTYSDNVESQAQLYAHNYKEKENEGLKKTKRIFFFTPATLWYLVSRSGVAVALPQIKINNSTILKIKQGVPFRNTCQDFAKKRTKALQLSGVHLASRPVILLLSQASFPARAESQPSVADRRNSSAWIKRCSVNAGAQFRVHPHRWLRRNQSSAH